MLWPSGKVGHDHQFFRNRRIFEGVNASSENFRTFGVSKNKSFEFYRKIIELGQPYSTGVTTPSVRVHVFFIRKKFIRK